MKIDTLLIGALDFPNTPKAGDSIKNRLILSWFKQNFDNVLAIDTQHWRTRPFVLIKILSVLIFRKVDNIVISVSNQSAYRLIRIIQPIKRKRTKFFYFMIGGYTPIKIKQGIFKAKPFKKLDKIIVEADRVKDFFSEVGIHNVYRVYNFKFTSFVADINFFKTNKVRFVFLSRLTELKGVFHIIRSTLSLNENGLANNFQVDFYGSIDPPIKSRFFDEIQRIPNISYNGFLDLRKDSNYKVLTAYDALLFPTMHETEGFPGVIADAAIAGLPVIASDWAYANELISTPKCGIVFPVGDNRALTKIMHEIIVNRDIVQTLRANCISRSKLYRGENVLTKQLLLNIGMTPNATIKE